MLPSLLFSKSILKVSKQRALKMICLAVKVTKFVIYAKSILRHFAVRFVNITKGSLKRTDVRSIK